VRFIGVTKRICAVRPCATRASRPRLTDRRLGLGYPAPVDEANLALQLIAFDTSEPSGLDDAFDFVGGWLTGRGVPIREVMLGDRRCLRACVGEGPLRVVLNGHLDVVPGRPEQFHPERRGGRLYGRGAYDMKAAVACMLLAMADLAEQPLEGVEVELVIVPDEERATPGANCSQILVDDGLRADFVICGEPTDMHVGIQAKGVLMLSMTVPGRAAHGSTPWLGDNAVLRAVDHYRRIESLPFVSETSDLLERPSVNLGRIQAGDALNMVPDSCRVDVDIRFLPEQSPGEVLRQVASLDDEVAIEVLVERPAAMVAADEPLAQLLLEAARRHAPDARMVGRDGSSDAIPFLEVGVPAVEFGPVGAGHHGPDEFVEIASLAPYRRALVDFVRCVGSHAPEPTAAV
jgi:succinyl-diaminopimelate desuccinylase